MLRHRFFACLAVFTFALAGCSADVDVDDPSGDELTGATADEVSSERLPLGSYLRASDPGDASAISQFQRLDLYKVADGAKLYSRFRGRLREQGVFELVRNTTTDKRYIVFYEADGKTLKDRYEYELRIVKGVWTGEVTFRHRPDAAFAMSRVE